MSDYLTPGALVEVHYGDGPDGWVPGIVCHVDPWTRGCGVEPDVWQSIRVTLCPTAPADARIHDGDYWLPGDVHPREPHVRHGRCPAMDPDDGTECGWLATSCGYCPGCCRRLHHPTTHTH